MRVLVTSVPSTGHIHPMMPLALGLQRAAHEVVWATGEKAHARIEGYGIAVALSGEALQVPTTQTGLMPWPGLDDLPPRERRAAAFGKRFAATAEGMRRDLAPIVERFRPDLIVHDMAELAAAPVATARGIPHVTVAFSGPPSERMLAGIVDAVQELWGDEGLTVPPDAGLYSHLYLHPFPSALGPAPRNTTVRSVRPVGFDGGATAERPGWLDSVGIDRPAVYLTLGTVVTGPAQWREMLAAIGSLDIDAIATTGSQVDPAEIGPAPDNVRVERYIPQSFILDRVAALVSHAGAGTLLAGASQGLPQLCLPMGADMWENADALAGSGASITLEEDERDAPAIASALERLLSDDAVARTAQAVAAEIAALPHPDEYVAVCESLVRT